MLLHITLYLIQQEGNKALFPNATNAETDYTSAGGGVSSFDTGGFTLAANSENNLLI